MIGRAFNARPSRYLVGGVICAVLHNVIVIGAAAAGVHYAAALILSFAVVTPIGYLLHSLFTFRCALSGKQFMRFATGVAAGFPVSLAIMLLLCSGLAMPVTLATPIATVLLVIFNYFLSRWAIPLWRHARPIGDHG